MSASGEQDTAPLLQLVPLFMPSTDDPYEPVPDWFPHRATAEREVPGHPVSGTTPVDADRVFWFRWITGHQISFALWRVMADVVSGRPDDLPSRHELDVLTACVDGYSAMLLYSSTVPREHYHARIRARMALQHPSFSGAWAPDYRPVRRIFRGKVAWLDEPAAAGLAEAVRRNVVTHDHIADHLVPDGRSLLQKSVGSPGVRVSRQKEDLYDNLFLTIRRPVSRTELVAQLDTRIDEVVTDLVRHGLYPEVDGRHHPVVGPDDDPVMRPLVTGQLDTLDRVSRRVRELELEGVRG